MLITDVLCVPVRSGFFTDDQAAIALGAAHDGATYVGTPVTPGFRSIRQAGEAVSVLLVLDDGRVAHGDCAAVQYSGVGGRDAVFEAASAIAAIQDVVAPLLIGRGCRASASWRREIEALRSGGAPLHTAVRYGVSQAAARCRCPGSGRHHGRGGAGRVRAPACPSSRSRSSCRAATTGTTTSTR